jgi:trk system potassium uptake protein TrkA
MRVVIAGAGAVGRSIAHDLHATQHKVLLIERQRSHFRPELVPEVDWMLADACELGTLQTAGIATCDAVIAATGDDRANLVFSMLSKTQFNVARVVARINDPANQWLFTSAWGIDVAVSTPTALVSAVETAVVVGDIVALATLQHGGGAIVEISVPETSAIVGMTVGSLPLPEDAALVMVVRDDAVVQPTPDLLLRARDGLVFAARPEVEGRIRALVRAERPTP